ncbi:MAG: maleylpyruvate isomerase N-terminal domain-containing protein [Anaerolineae bacterium]|nr:maleylpyruvate isomerase N-terminal domain-containing protein [Anaerolineae bacterium]
MQPENTFAEIIVNFETAYAEFFATAHDYPQALRTASGVCGVWSPKELLAHFSGWIAEAMRRYRAYPRGSGEMDYNVDAFNQVSVWQRRSMTYDEVVAELETLVAQLAEMARQIPAAQIERDYRYAYWLREMTREAHEHGEELRAFQEINA